MKNLSTLFIFILLTSGCSHYYYAPNEGAVLALNEKNDLKFSFGQAANSTSLLLGYSPIKHLGIQSSYFNAVGNTSDNVSKGHLANVAIGAYYFHPFKKNESKSKKTHKLAMESGILFDLYGGFGKGAVHNYYEQLSSSHFKFYKTFVQAGLHLQGKFIGFDYVLKVGNLDYYSGKIERLSKIHETDILDFTNIIRLDPFDFRESTLKIHVGNKYGRLFFSSTILTSSKLTEVKFMSNTISLGAMVEIDEIFIKKKSIKKQLE